MLEQQTKGGDGRVRSLGKLFFLCCCVSLLSLGNPNEIRPATSNITVTLPDEHIPMVALTFDDGPRADTTTRLLDGLALREVPATFFLVGEHIAENEDIILRMAEEGHQIGLHSYDHIYLKDLCRADFDEQVEKPRTMLKALLPDEEFWLRPPYGIFDAPTQQWAGTPIILWSLDPKDWEFHDASYIVGVVASQVQDGDIILLHDIYPESVDGALLIVDALSQRGYTFGTVEQLLAHQGITPENGVIYPKIPWIG